jgi:hypothetical protein
MARPPDCLLEVRTPILSAMPARGIFPVRQVNEGARWEVS